MFDGDPFPSTTCERYGFGKAGYTLAQRGDAYAFESDSRNARGGVHRRSGRVEGGTLFSRDPGQEAIVYEFRGSERRSSIEANEQRAGTAAALLGGDEREHVRRRRPRDRVDHRVAEDPGPSL